MKYLRFIVSEKHPESGVPMGPFGAFYELRENGKLTSDEEKNCKRLGGWFAKNLKKPDKFTTSKKPHAPTRAICWIKMDAHEHISKLREITIILEHHEVRTKIIMTDKPGYITYEDAYQVVAEPFSDTAVKF